MPLDDPLTWQDPEGIGIALFEADSETNPLTLRFTEILDRILALPNFQGNRMECNEARLEAIQMAWLEEFQEK